MIQRIQTIWLIITTLLSGFLMKGPIINFSANNELTLYLSFTGIHNYKYSGPELLTGSIALSAVIILIPVISVLTIFLYKRRRIQKVVSLVAVTFSVCLLILLSYYTYLAIKNYSAVLVPGIKMFLPFAIVIFSFLGYKGISSDDNLVRSYDRLR